MMRLTGFLSVLLWALCNSCQALEQFAPTDAELKSLPHYCTVKLMGTNSPEYATWEQSLGPDFIHTHHFCFGLNFINRYYRSRNAPDKRFNLQSAETNLGYMVQHAQPNYSLMPEVYLNRGLVFSLMQRNAEAVRDMLKALELNPRQVKAYIVLADYHAGSKQTNKALEVITKGLQYNPGTKGLQRRYRELGGKLPYPESLQIPAVETQPQPPSPTPKAIDSLTVDTEPATPENDKPSPIAAPDHVPAESGTQPKIGSPKNPYCRFCPD